MNVVKMPGPEGRDVALVLSKMLKEAVGGRLCGIAISYCMASGEESSLVAGCYATDPTAALKAGLRQSWTITLGQEAARPPAKPTRPRRKRKMP